jgi:Ca-activated chloride channel family protein
MRSVNSTREPAGSFLAFTMIISAAVLMAPRDANAAGLLKPIGAPDDHVLIKSHHVHVTINNGFARTEVDQVFENTSDQDREAIYTFPLPRQSSLSELSLWIDGNEVLGEVVEKQKAREIYEQQVAHGNDTALAEKNDFKTFDVNVGVVRAHSETRVRLVYYQPLEIDLNVGRYLYPLAEGNVDDDRIPFWSIDDRVSSGVSFNLELKSAFPVEDVRVPGFEQIAQISKRAGAEEQSGDVYDISLVLAEDENLSRDIVLYYRLDDTVPGRVELVPYRQDPGEDGTFMVVVTPAASLQRIADGTDWIFVLDVSGSMGGHKISTLADGVSRVIGRMSPNDRFRIVTFNNSAREVTPGHVAATPENVSHWIQQVKGLQADGGTALFAGLKEGYRSLDEDRTTGLILVTDAVCNIGPTEHSAFIKLLNNYDVRLFTFVIGNSANQPLMDRLAKDSGGFAMNLADADDIVGRLLQAKAKVLHECMYDVELKFHGEKVSDLTPREIGNIYIGQQIVLFGRYSGSGEVDVELRARVSGQDQSWHSKALLQDVDRDNPEIERLWALAAIEETMQAIRDKGESKKLTERVTELGLAYSLVTDYTSMLVVGDDVSETEGIQRLNAQRVQRERQAQQARQTAPVKNYRVDNSSENGGMFRNAPSPGIGTGPIGPLFIGLLVLITRMKSRMQS